MAEQTRLNSIENVITEAKGNPSEGVKEAGDADTGVTDTGGLATSVADTSVTDTSILDAVTGWRDGLPEELKNAPSLAKFKDQASLVKSYLESEKALSSRIALPKEDAPEAEWDAFYKKIGRPEDKRYRPDHLSISGDEEPMLARYEEILHSSGLSKKQGQKVLGQMVDLSAQMEAEAKAGQETLRAENLAVLQKEFGDGMDLKVRQIKAALGEFGTDASLAALVEQTNYHPALVQFLACVGEQLASGRLVTGDSPKLSTSRQTALDEIKRLETDEAFQVNYRGSDSDKRQEAVNRMNDLYRTAYPQTSDI